MCDERERLTAELTECVLQALAELDTHPAPARKKQLAEIILECAYAVRQLYPELSDAQFFPRYETAILFVEALLTRTKQSPC